MPTALQAGFTLNRHLFDGGRGVRHEVAAGRHGAREGDLSNVRVRAEQVTRLAFALEECRAG